MNEPNLKCDSCGKDITNAGEGILQARRGWTEEGEFYAEEDIGYCCENCIVLFYHR